MSIKNINSRITHKHDTEANWNEATSFVPLQGEIIVYDRDDNLEGALKGEHTHPRIKIGDGVTPVTSLEFIDKNALLKIEQLLTDEEIRQVRKNLKLIGEDVAGKTFTINGESVVASVNAEIFGDYATNIATG